MEKKLEQRLNGLRQEYNAGQKMLADLEAQKADLQQTLLRISGAIQVLEELLATEAPLEYVHQKCGHKTRATLTCSECGEPLRPEEVKPRLGPALRKLVAESGAAGEPHPDIPPLLRGTPSRP